MDAKQMTLNCKKNIILDFIHCMFEVKSRKSEKIELMKIELAVKVNEQKGQKQQVLST